MFEIVPLAEKVFIYCFWPLLFRKASSDPVKWWLQQLTKNGVPVLVCLTYADVLYLECKEADRQEDIATELEVYKYMYSQNSHISCHLHSSTEIN